MPKRNQVKIIGDRVSALVKDDEILRLGNELKKRDELIEVLRKDARRGLAIAGNPFLLLKEFVPDLDMEADGTFDLTSLSKEDYIKHLNEGWLFYNSITVNREISAMVNGLQRYALCLPDTSIEGFKTSRQCLAFVKGFIDRFKELANMHDSRKPKPKQKKSVQTDES